MWTQERLTATKDAFYALSEPGVVEGVDVSVIVQRDVETYGDNDAALGRMVLGSFLKEERASYSIGDSLTLTASGETFTLQREVNANETYYRVQLEKQ